MSAASDYARTAAELIVQQGNARAQRAANSGQVWATTLRELGGLPRQAAQMKQQEQDRALQHQVAQSQLSSADLQRQALQGQMADRASDQKAQDAQRALAEKTRKAHDWLASIASVEDPNQREAIYQQGRAALIAEGTIDATDAPEGKFPGQSWVRSKLALTLPATEQFNALFPGAPKLIERDPTKDLANPTTGAVVSPGTPAPTKPTYAAPQPVMVNGKRVLARAGSDGALYDMAGTKIGNAQPDVPPQPPKQPSDDLVQVMGPNGVPVWTRKTDAVGQPAVQAPRAVTGQERGVLAFYNRAKQAVDTITASADGGDSLEQKIAKAGLAAQGRLQYAPNFAQTKENQSYRQAQRSFTEARLRKESGAAIPDAEYENDAKTYFAQPGDDADIIEQKRAARQTVLDGLKFSSGKAYEEYYGEPNTSPARTQKESGPKEGETKPIPGYPGTEQTYRGGKWIRTK